MYSNNTGMDGRVQVWQKKLTVIRLVAPLVQTNSSMIWRSYQNHSKSISVTFGLFGMPSELQGWGTTFDSLGSWPLPILFEDMGCHPQVPLLQLTWWYEGGAQGGPCEKITATTRQNERRTPKWGFGQCFSVLPVPCVNIPGSTDFKAGLGIWGWACPKRFRIQLSGTTLFQDVPSSWRSPPSHKWETHEFWKICSIHHSFYTWRA